MNVVRKFQPASGEVYPVAYVESLRSSRAVGYLEYAGGLQFDFDVKRTNAGFRARGVTFKVSKEQLISKFSCDERVALAYAPAMTGRVVMGQESQSGEFTSWLIDWDNGQSGWINEDDLVRWQADDVTEPAAILEKLVPYVSPDDAQLSAIQLAKVILDRTIDNVIGCQGG